MFWHQLQDELFKLFARKRTYIGFGAFVVFEAIVLVLLSLPQPQAAFGELLLNNGLQFEDGFTGLTVALAILFFTSVLRGVYLALVAGDLVSKEVEEGTLRLVLARPVTRARIFWLKALVNAIHTVVLMVFVGASCLLAGVLYRGGLGNLVVWAPTEGVFAVFAPGEGLWRYGCAVLLLGVVYQSVAALGLMFSTFDVRPATATGLTLSVVFLDLMLSNMPCFAPIRGWFFTQHLLCWIHSFDTVVLWNDITMSLCILLGLTGTFWTVGAVCFCIRDFKA